MDEAEIDRMVREAEEHADEDREMREKVDSRNAAESLIHSVRTTLKDLGDQVEESDKTAIESAIKELESALESDAGADEVKAKTEALAEASHGLAMKAYNQSQSGPQEPASASDSDVEDADVVAMPILRK